MIFILVLLLITLTGIVCLVSLSSKAETGLSADDFQIVEIK